MLPGLIGGDFDVAGGWTRKCLARFDRDGAVDPSFNAGEIKAGSYTGPVVYNLTLQPDGKILAAGTFNILAVRLVIPWSA